jgi:aspartate/methionine/tyrosine aminotransferase
MKVSQRSQTSPFIAVEVFAAANARRARGEDVLNLCLGEPATGASQPILDRAAAALKNDSLGYTESAGLPELRMAIAGHYENWYDVDVDPARVLVTTGSSGGFVLAFLAAFDVGDRVVLARPGYPAYANILKALGCEVIELSCGPETRYQPTVGLLEQIDGDIDGLVIASPANPSGTMIDPHELEALARWCGEHGVRLVSDEIYHGITYAEEGAEAPATATAAQYVDQGVIVVSSFSKYWGMTGWRLGWLVLPDDLIESVYRLAGNVALCPPALPQYAALAAFTPEAMAAGRENVHRYAEARALILSRLDDLGWNTIAPADGAFYIYANIAQFGLDAVTYCERLLDEAGVALTPGTDFDPARGHDWVRLSFAVSLDVVKQAIDRIVAWQRGL